jgi:hypothetical protein
MIATFDCQAGGVTVIAAAAMIVMSEHCCVCHALQCLV